MFRRQGRLDDAAACYREAIALASTDAELDVPKPGTPPTKVRGYFCAHAHLFSLKQPSGRRPVQQVVAGTGGSDPDPAPSDEGELPVGVVPKQKYPWFGFAVVAVRSVAFTFCSIAGSAVASG